MGNPGTSKVLDVVPLRSFVAVADCGGHHRAARALHLSQSTISQHIRRLEAVVGQSLTERDGRTTRLTEVGELLLTEARRMLAAHDEMLRRVALQADPDLVVGATEHGADHLIPQLAAALAADPDAGRVRFRIDRGTPLRSAIDRGDVDLALLIGAADRERTVEAGMLPLGWFAAPGWRPPTPGAGLPLVAFDDPCAIRNRALETLAEHGTRAEMACEATNLGGVLAAARAGLGVAMLADVGPAPDGLVPQPSLPTPRPVPLVVRWRSGLSADLATAAADAVRERVRTAPALRSVS
ncbi:LysR family transcriptional regulator [Nakamurella leprariae]|uniref:LysR family transcriptional regulator n=1 Tax=Nakamurella leprariae TaxID=2803911 RepID=A0A939C027_9ACTN|nr:LysR family transcriptional regulator [Nakamurella leprariae]MBM9468326.1 LysR family transcriptional regulator [Nakamurella leprariae]